MFDFIGFEPQQHRSPRPRDDGNIIKLLDDTTETDVMANLAAGQVHHEDYRNRVEAKGSIFEYIELFYKRRRRHSYNGQMAPLAFEAAASVAS